MLAAISTARILFFFLTFWFIFYALTSNLKILGAILVTLVILGLGFLFSPLPEAVLGPLTMSDRVPIIGFALLLSCIGLMYSGTESIARRKVLLLKSPIFAIAYLFELYLSYLATYHAVSQ